jgi:hypothetical protein
LKFVARRVKLDALECEGRDKFGGVVQLALVRIALVETDGIRTGLLPSRLERI